MGLREKTTRRKVGILGGGQLARMMILEAHRLGVGCEVLCYSQQEPAAQILPRWHNINDPKSRQNFFQEVDVLTFESEFFDIQNWTEYNDHRSRLVVAPSVEAIGVLRDRRSQKELLSFNQIPTSEFFSISSDDEMLEFRSFLDIDGFFPFVYKKALGGYDGNGTFMVRNPDEFGVFPAPGIVEHLVSFEREVAVMVGRTSGGECFHYPLVESFQVDSRCDWVVGPQDEKTFRKSVWPAIVRLLEQINYVGMLGVEMFELKNGSLLVNELAPRVHNSGHYTQEAFTVDQFAAHLYCVLGLKGSIDLTPKWESYGMVNLIGCERPETCQRSTLHWYGKLEPRTGRKMGHLNLGMTTKNKKTLVKALLEDREIAIGKKKK